LTSLDPLEQFYQGQARVYDATRAGLLRGRNTMLAMSAEHLRVIQAERPTERLVWVDVRGGTGTLLLILIAIQ